MDMEVPVCYGPHDVRLEREPLEALGPGDVRVRVAYRGVCPWDLCLYSGRSSSARYPLHLGHEMSGTVAEVGPDVRDLGPGQPVVADAIHRCGVCAACRRGLENHCAAADYSRGGFARFILAPAGNVCPLRLATPLLHAAFTEPLACIVRAQNRLALIEDGAVRLDPLVTDLYPLPTLAAIDRVASSRGLKVMVQCDPSAPAGEPRLDQKETQ